jgi:hypothetical protein
MLQSNEPNIFAREVFCGISFVCMGQKKKRAVRATGEHARCATPPGYTPTHTGRHTCFANACDKAGVKAGVKDFR